MTVARALGRRPRVQGRGRRSSTVLRALDAGIATSHEILVVYDFDEDPTVPVIDRLHAELPSIRGLRNDLGRGVLNAMRWGSRRRPATYVLVSMADGSDGATRGGRDGGAGARRRGRRPASRYMAGGEQGGGPPSRACCPGTAGPSLHWFAGLADARPDERFKIYRGASWTGRARERRGLRAGDELTVKASLDRCGWARSPRVAHRTAGGSNFKLAVAPALPALVLAGPARSVPCTRLGGGVRTTPQHRPGCDPAGEHRLSPRPGRAACADRRPGS